MNTPDWLRQRGGELKLGSDKATWYVVVGGKPLYDLVAVPAAGEVHVRGDLRGLQVRALRHDLDAGAVGAGVPQLGDERGGVPAA